ncbi:MAG TPA: hypothetical protein VFG04_14080 [Planctomycetaceae bacterium]|jgi:hypothetical protein|nr:hypothetical protein [Planctomycetaceae bacterium]
MADAIGDFLFVSLHGKVGVSKTVLEDISRKGVEGSAWRIDPPKGKTCVLNGEAIFPENTEAIAAEGAYAELIGTLQTIAIGGIGDYTGMMIEDVEVSELPKLIFTSLGWEFRVLSTWWVRAT